MKVNMENTRAFFAAANGYDGFRSNFNTVFSPRRLKRLFVIKGGPGTGKSTLMRKISEKFATDANVTLIYCSSDTRSLDGVLIEKNGVVIGIADGTAPHVIEPSYPGAIEEIINLGDGFDYKGLGMLSQQIKEISEYKRNAYDRAYTALHAAGEIKRYIDAAFCNSEAYNAAEKISDDLICNQKCTESVEIENAFLISAFSKDGYTTLSYPHGTKRVVRIFGDGISEYWIMNRVAKKLQKQRAVTAICSAPFSKEMVELVETTDTVYIAEKAICETNDTVISTDKLKDYSAIKKSYDALLSEAQKEFSKASAHHFALEEIYSRNIAFEYNEERKNRIIKEIKEIFAN